MKRYPNPKWLIAAGLILTGNFAYSQASSHAAPPQAPVAYSSVNQLNGVLTQIEQAGQTALADTGKLRVEKWKTDSSTKHQAQSDVQSIQRNLQSALPEILNQLRSSPEDLAATLRLYRNLNALYDVFSAVAESAGAFGPKEDYQALANDLGMFQQSRRSVADRAESLAASKQGELDRLREQVRVLAAAPPAPPTKTVVDDTEPVKKPVRKKSARKPATGAAAQPPAAVTPPQ